MSDCQHDEVGYFAAVNEAGWKCLDCGNELGYRPDLDVSQIEAKVMGLLMDLHEHKFVYVSNGALGEIIVENVAAHCGQKDRYDQASILAYIVVDPNLDARGHGDYWAERRHA